jgi:hypothetical protein
MFNVEKGYTASGFCGPMPPVSPAVGYYVRDEVTSPPVPNCIVCLFDATVNSHAEIPNIIEFAGGQEPFR